MGFFIIMVISVCFRPLTFEHCFFLFGCCNCVFNIHLVWQISWKKTWSDYVSYLL